jgi:hypothetical protein
VALFQEWGLLVSLDRSNLLEIHSNMGQLKGTWYIITIVFCVLFLPQNTGFALFYWRNLRTIKKEVN